jgi:signal transduction histidine kinase
MKRVIRHRLLTIVLLGVLTSALSVVALVQLLKTSTSQRVERARDALVDETERLARSPSQLTNECNTNSPSAVVFCEPASTLVGIRAGLWSAERPAPPISPEFEAEIRAAISEAGTTHQLAIRETPVRQGTLVVAARGVRDPREARLPADTIVFTVYLVRLPPSIRTWQEIVALLVAATVLLVATSAYAILTVNRGANALRNSLDELATNLEAEVPQTRVRELDGIAEGIAGLAKKLVEARTKQEKLSRELAHNERLAALGRVAAGVAHEVRNPLASIKLRLDLAAAGSSLPPSAEEAIAHATSEIQRLDKLVADLLFLAGRAVGPKGPSDLGALVTARVFLIAPWAEERGVTVEVSGEGTASLDNDTMARAIDNLLRNAVEASPRGGKVEARVESSNDRVVLVVCDRGAGVPSDRAAELFEPFFTTKAQGTGLGLAISRAIARAHEGDLVYTREKGETRFSLSLAARPPKKESRAA